MDATTFARIVTNIFCPTGPGGGIKPTCSVKGGGASSGTPSQSSIKADSMAASKRRSDHAMKFSKKADRQNTYTAHIGASNLHQQAAADSNLPVARRTRHQKNYQEHNAKAARANAGM
jgi:hypothetical protein